MVNLVSFKNAVFLFTIQESVITLSAPYNFLMYYVPYNNYLF